jgi:uncharacterized Zn finger protein
MTKAQEEPRFDIEAVRGLVGDKVFARGEAYHRDGQVRILTIEPDRVLAQVAGSENYRTHLVGRGKKPAGACSCPAFMDRGFCKHMVALALTANAGGGETEEIGVTARIRRHLTDKGVDALADLIIEPARYATLYRKGVGRLMSALALPVANDDL